MRRSILVMLLFILFSAVPALAVEPVSGEVLVLDAVNDALVLVDPEAYDGSSANQTLVTSDNLITNPHDVAIAGGVAFVTDRNLGGIVRVDLSDMSQTQVPVNVSGTPLALDPSGIAIRSDGALLVLDADRFTIVEIDPETGAAADLTPSIFFGGFRYIALGPNDEIYVSQTSQEVNRVFPATQQAPRVGSLRAHGLAVDPATGHVYVADPDADEIVLLDPDAYDSGDPTANQTLVSDHPLVLNPEDVGLLPNGDLVFSTGFSNNNDLLQVDIDSGVPSVVGKGGNLLRAMGLAVVVPEASAFVQAFAVMSALSMIARRRTSRP